MTKEKKIKFHQAGITIFASVIIMSVLLIITFILVDIVIKGTIFTSSSRDSQLAFFAADSGVECAIYWDSNSNAFNTGSSATWAEVHITEFSGIDRFDPLEQTAIKSEQNSGNPINISSGSKTTVYPEQMIFGYTDQWYYTLGDITGDGMDDTVQPGPGFIKIAGDFSDAITYKNVTTAGSYDASFTLDNPTNINGIWGAIMTTFKAAPGETPAFVQHKAGDRSVGSATNVTFDNPSSNGNFITVAFQYDTFDFNLDSVTDNKGNTYLRAAGPLAYLDNGSPRTQEVWYARNITGGGDPIIINGNSTAFTPVDLVCNGQVMPAGLGPSSPSSELVQTNPTQRRRIGGTAAENNPEKSNRSIFQLNFANGTCAIVRVDKEPGLPTVIFSRGYNTCDINHPRRVERGLEVTY